MAEIDTEPLESVQDALSFFEQKFDQNRSSQNGNEEKEIDLLSKELANCKLQLELKENANKQANLKLEVLHKTIEELSDKFKHVEAEKDKYGTECSEAQNRINQLETDNSLITSQQSEIVAECKALKDELLLMKYELNAVKETNLFASRQVELLEATLILERENTKEALMHILELNEAALSSALVAMKAEEERLAFFRGIGPEFFMSDEKLEAIKRQLDTIQSLENEMLVKTIEIDYLQSELKQAKELYISSQKVLGLRMNTTDLNGQTELHQSDSKNINDKMTETVMKKQEPQAEFTFPISAECRGNSEAADTCFANEISREDYQTVQSEDKNVDAKMSGSVAEDQEPQAEVTVPNSSVCKGNSEAEETCFVSESSREDYQTVQSDDKNINGTMSGNVVEDQEPQAEVTGPNLTARQGNSEAADTCFVTEISREEDEFYTKEFGQANKLDEYVFVGKKSEVDALKDELDAAHTEISDLRFRLEEAARRAELAEEAKAAIEDQLKDQIQKRSQQRRASSVCVPTMHDEPPSSRPTPSRKPGLLRGSRSAPRGDEKPLHYVTLGKVLNMKFNNK